MSTTAQEALRQIVGVSPTFNISTGYDSMIHEQQCDAEWQMSPDERIKLARAMIARWRNVILLARLERRR